MDSSAEVCRKWMTTARKHALLMFLHFSVSLLVTERYTFGLRGLAVTPHLAALFQCLNCLCGYSIRKLQNATS